MRGPRVPEQGLSYAGGRAGGHVSAARSLPGPESADRPRRGAPLGSRAALGIARGERVSAGKSGSGGRRVIVLGGTSEIALAIVGGLQRRAPREVVLVGRDGGALAGAAAGR